MAGIQKFWSHYIAYIWIILAVISTYTASEVLYRVDPLGRFFFVNIKTFYGVATIFCRIFGSIFYICCKEHMSDYLIDLVHISAGMNIGSRISSVGSVSFVSS